MAVRTYTVHITETKSEKRNAKNEKRKTESGKRKAENGNV